MSIVFKGEFLGFTFNGKHSSLFDITRTSVGDRHSLDVFPDFSNTFQSVPGRDGSYDFGVDIKEKRINVPIAFERITDKQLHELVSWLSPKKRGALVFDEHPYKQYWVAIDGAPNISYVPFDGERQNQTVYNGEGTITFIAFDPYSYCENPVLTDYTDDYDKPWGIDYLPPWAWSGQLIPESDFNKVGWGIPELENYLYIAGTEECMFDIWVKFWSAADVSGALQSYIGDYETKLVSIHNQILKVRADILDLDDKIKHLTARKKEIVEKNGENELKIASLEREILTKQGKILELRGNMFTKNSQLAGYRKDLQEVVAYQEATEQEITENSELLDRLLLIDKPNTEKVQEIENSRLQENLLKDKKTRLDTSHNAFTTAIIDTEQEALLLREEIETSTRELTTLTSDLANTREEVQDLSNELKEVNSLIAPTQNDYDINKKELKRLEEEQVAYKATIAEISATGVSFDGSLMTIERSEQEGLPAQTLQIELSDELKGKTLRINANTGDISYYDSEGRRYSYLHKVEGNPITAMPTGYHSVEDGTFSATATPSNVVTLNRPLTKEERLIGRYILFKESHREVHTITKITNTREKGETTELVLEEPYSLTQGERPLLILNELVELSFSDLRYVEKMNIVYPYKYY